jgi:acyl-CoA reductase-like NAD-dependent aldehyde dehydrogenase
MRGRIERFAMCLEWDSDELNRNCGCIVPSEGQFTGYVQREPIGPVAAFTRRNAPMSAPPRKISGRMANG